MNLGLTISVVAAAASSEFWGSSSSRTTVSHEHYEQPTAQGAGAQSTPILRRTSDTGLAATDLTNKIYDISRDAL
jgi:hypothetical protein